ncbi:hypothetical protein [Nonomuraea angiospora]|nr:hypothetical protein [Nonomuraea angiospora]MDX3105791.1 hypothetical protein [Nonomuraea angiospora]
MRRESRAARTVAGGLRQVSLEVLRDLAEVRATIEPGAASLAALRGTMV